MKIILPSASPQGIAKKYVDAFKNVFQWSEGEGMYQDMLKEMGEDYEEYKYYKEKNGTKTVNP